MIPLTVIRISIAQATTIYRLFLLRGSRVKSKASNKTEDSKVKIKDFQRADQIMDL